MARLPIAPQVERGEHGEIVAVVKSLIEYAKDKGQIPSAAAFAQLELYGSILEELGLAQLGGKLKRLPQRVLELSPHEPRRFETVWQYVLKEVAQGLVTKIEMTEQKKRMTKVANLG